MLASLAAAGDGSLHLCEPTFIGMPIEWEWSSTRTLAETAIQSAICDAVGLEPDFAWLQAPAIISPEFLEASAPFVIQREEADDNATGWLMHEDGFDGSDARWASLYEISLHHPWIIPFMGLSAGATVWWDGEVVEIEASGTRVSSKDGSILSDLVKSPWMRARAG